MNPEEDTPRAEPVVSEVRVDYRDFYPEKPNAGLHAEPLPVQPVSAEKQPEEPAAALVLEAPKEAPKTEASFSAPEQTKEPEKQPQGKQAVRPVVHKYGFAAGVAALLAALAGVVLLVCAVGGKIAAAAQNTGDLHAWDPLLDAVVWNDPAPFEQLSDAAPGDLCACAVRNAMQALSEPETDELGRVLVPFADAESACKKLFGPDAALQPQDGAFYTYDAAQNLFLVTPLPNSAGYTAKVETVETNGKTIRLKVGCFSGVSQQEPDKWMEYTLQETPKTGQVYISSVRAWKEPA